MGPLGPRKNGQNRVADFMLDLLQLYRRNYQSSDHGCSDEDLIWLFELRIQMNADPHDLIWSWRHHDEGCWRKQNLKGDVMEDNLMLKFSLGRLMNALLWPLSRLMCTGRLVARLHGPDVLPTMVYLFTPWIYMLQYSPNRLPCVSQSWVLWFRGGSWPSWLAVLRASLLDPWIYSYCGL